MTQLERKLFVRSAIVGTILTVIVLLLDAWGTLSGLEKWLYDRRARDCQFFNKPPTTQILHIDIDDRSLEAVGKWPWPRDRIATILAEIGRAGPKAVGTDIVFSEKAEIRLQRRPDSIPIDIDEDAAMEAALAQMGNVIVPASLLIAPTKSVSAIESAMQGELMANLELSAEQLTSRLRVRGFKSDEVRERVAEEFFRARRVALYRRILQETERGSIPKDLARRLLPTTDTTVNSPLLRTFEGEIERVQAFRELERFAIPRQDGIPAPLATVPNALPLPGYTRAARGAGFADDSLTEPVVRSMPMFVECEGRIFPQWGLAFACVLTDADLSNAKLSAGTLRIPAPNREIVIPLRYQYSQVVRRAVPYIADVPWFGKTEWRTMYDWPNHVEPASHLPISRVWEICQTRKFIRKNNRAIDQAVRDLLDEPSDVLRLGMDSGIYKKYAESLPLLDEPLSRQSIIDQADKVVKESPFLEAYNAIPANDRKPEDVAAFEIFSKAPKAMRDAINNNRELAAQLNMWTAELAAQLGGKGVLIGWTATGAVDMVTTPLHPRCPGVVVHGAIANAVLTDQWLRVTPFWITGLLTLILGLGIAYTTSWFSPTNGLFTAVLTATIYFVINGVIVFDWGNWILGAAGPMVAIATVWSGSTVTRLIVEGIERIKKEREIAVFEHEMGLAKGVQQALIPKEDQMPKIAGIEPFGWTKAADATGGDLFDLWTLPDGRLGILVADASGHGLAPSVIVSQVRTLVRALSEIETHPNPLLARVDARLAQDLEPARFVTAFLGFMSGDGTLHWASAGHGPMLWCSCEGEEYQSLDATALPLGIMEDFMGDDIPPLQLDKGGMLIVTSDGIFEAPDPKGEQFGIERIIETLKSNCGQPPLKIVNEIRDAVTTWQAKDKPADDQTTVIIRRVEAGVSVTVVESNTALATAS